VAVVAKVPTAQAARAGLWVWRRAVSEHRLVLKELNGFSFLLVFPICLCADSTFAMKEFLMIFFFCFFYPVLN